MAVLYECDTCLNTHSRRVSTCRACGGSRVRAVTEVALPRVGGGPIGPLDASLVPASLIAGGLLGGLRWLLAWGLGRLLATDCRPGLPWCPQDPGLTGLGAGLWTGLVVAACGLCWLVRGPRTGRL